MNNYNRIEYLSRLIDRLGDDEVYIDACDEAMEVIGEYIKLLEQPSPASGWLPIESAPKDGRLVLFDMDSFGVCPGYYSEDGWGDDSYALKYTWVFYDHLDGKDWNALKDDYPPKAWMPLPSNATPPQPIGCNQEAQPQHESCECYPINSDVYMLVECTKRIIRSEQNQIIQEHKDIMDKYIGKLITKTSEEAR